MEAFRKYPLDVLDYTVDATAWLSTADSVTSFTWTVPAPLVNVSQVDVGAKSTVIISGGVDQARYCIEVDISTALGLSKTIKFQIAVYDDQ